MHINAGPCSAAALAVITQLLLMLCAALAYAAYAYAVLVDLLQRTLNEHT